MIPLPRDTPRGHRKGDRGKPPRPWLLPWILGEPSWLYQLLPAPPPTGRRLLKDPRFSCNISSGSFPKFLLHGFLWLFPFWGNANASRSARESERKSSFKSPCSRLGRRTPRRPPSRSAAAIPGAQSRLDAEPGRWAGARAGGEGRKVQRPTGAPPARAPTGSPDLSFPATLEGFARALSLPKSRAKLVPRASELARLPADRSPRPRRPAGAHPRARAHGMLPAADALPQPPPAASEAGGFQPGPQPRVPARTRRPRLGGVTCSLRHPSGALR